MIFHLLNILLHSSATFFCFFLHSFLLLLSSAPFYRSFVPLLSSASFFHSYLPILSSVTPAVLFSFRPLFLHSSSFWILFLLFFLSFFFLSSVNHVLPAGVVFPLIVSYCRYLLHFPVLEFLPLRRSFPIPLPFLFASFFLVHVSIFYFLTGGGGGGFRYMCAPKGHDWVIFRNIWINFMRDKIFNFQKVGVLISSYM